MNMLKARLYDYEIKKKEQENQSTENSKSEIGWGHQIRSYVAFFYLETEVFHKYYYFQRYSLIL